MAACVCVRSDLIANVLLSGAHGPLPVQSAQQHAAAHSYEYPRTRLRGIRSTNNAMFVGINSLRPLAPSGTNTTTLHALIHGKLINWPGNADTERGIVRQMGLRGVLTNDSTARNPHCDPALLSTL